MKSHANYVAADATERHKKSITSKIVAPILTIESIIFFFAFVEKTAFEISVFIGLGVASVAINLPFTVKNFKIKFGKYSFDSRSDFIDVFRWMINFVIFDAIQFIIFKPSPVGHFAVWLILIVGAQADTVSRFSQRAVSIMGVVTAMALFLWMYPQLSMIEFVFIFFVLSSVLFIFNISERLWISEIAEKHEAQESAFAAKERENNLWAQTEEIKRTAALGEKLLFITHEMNNIIFVMDLARSDKMSSDQRDAFKKATDKLRGITRLVLNDLNGSQEVKEINTGDLLQDIELIIAKNIRNSGTKLEIVASDRIKQLVYRERQGSSFYILNNLLKNAREAVTREDENEHALGLITLSVREEEGLIVFEVTDNGDGMSPGQVQALMEGRGQTTKAGGHGIGMKFVRTEAKKNGFNFTVTSEPGRGTTASLIIDPNADPAAKAEELLTAI